ncbi:MAG: hypothetical protein AAB289_12495 [Chloroflexota bacterium]
MTQPPTEEAAVHDPWVCMDCGNTSRFQVVYYDVCALDQSGAQPVYQNAPQREGIEEQAVLQVACGACQSVRVGRRRKDESGEEVVVPGRWVREASAPAGIDALRESLDEIAPSLGVPEVQGTDGSLQWEVENPIANTKVLIGFKPENRMASVYARSGNAFIGYAALGPITSIATDLDQGEVQFVQQRGDEHILLSITEEGIFFVRSSEV